MGTSVTYAHMASMIFDMFMEYMKELGWVGMTDERAQSFKTVCKLLKGTEYEDKVRQDLNKCLEPALKFYTEKCTGIDAYVEYGIIPLLEAIKYYEE